MFLSRFGRLVTLFVLMHGSILPVTTPPGIPPGIRNFVLTWRSISHPRARRKRQFPTPGTPHWPQICVQNIDYDIDFRTVAKADVFNRT